MALCLCPKTCHYHKELLAKVKSMYKKGIASAKYPLVVEKP